MALGALRLANRVLIEERRAALFITDLHLQEPRLGRRHAPAGEPRGRRAEAYAAGWVAHRPRSRPDELTRHYHSRPLRAPIECLVHRDLLIIVLVLGVALNVALVAAVAWANHRAMQRARAVQPRAAGAPIAAEEMDPARVMALGAGIVDRDWIDAQLGATEATRTWAPVERAAAEEAATAPATTGHASEPALDASGPLRPRKRRLDPGRVAIDEPASTGPDGDAGGGPADAARQAAARGDRERADASPLPTALEPPTPGRRSRRFVMPDRNESQDRSQRAIATFLGQPAIPDRGAGPARRPGKRQAGRAAAPRTDMVISLGARPPDARLIHAISTAIRGTLRGSDEVTELPGGRLRISLEADARGGEAFLRRARTVVRPWLGMIDPELDLRVDPTGPGSDPGAGVPAT